MIIVVVIGGACVTGLYLYNQMVYKANRHALELDVNRFVGQVLTYWKTPTAGGGAGQDMTQDNQSSLGEFMGFAHISDLSGKKDFYSIITENGEIRILSVKDNTVVLEGLGVATRNGKHPTVQCTINLYTFVINTNMGNAKSF